MAILNVPVTTNFSLTTLSNITLVDFINTAGSATATFFASQFDNIQISSSVTFDGGMFEESIVVTNASLLNGAGWNFTNWNSADQIIFNGTGGNDDITGTSQRETINGGDGDDFIRSSAGLDNLAGDNGNDTFVYFNAIEAAFGETVDGGAGTRDRFLLTNNDVYTLANINFSGIEVIEFGGQDLLGTQYALLSSTPAAAHPGLIIRGDAGVDALWVVGGGNVDLSSYTFENWDPTGNNISGDFIQIDGLSSADHIIGTSQADVVVASGGLDVIFTGAGNDTYAVNAADFIQGVTVDFGVGNADALVLTGSGAFQIGNGYSGFERLSLVLGQMDVSLSGAQTGAGKLNEISLASASVSLTVSGSADLSNVTFNGWTSQSELTMTGTAGSDAIAGSSQNDIINGMGGADVLNGGGGDDIIFFDQFDTSLQGGSGYDAANYANATQGLRNYDMIAHTIEELTWITNGNLYVMTASSGGTKLEDVVDSAHSEASFAQRMTTIDSLNREELVNILTDAGTRFIYDYDPSNAAAWNLILQGYDTLARLDYTDTRYDNNSRVVRDDDQAAAFNWSSITTTYTDSGTVDFQDSVYDSNVRIIFDADQDNANNWASVSTTYAPNGAVDYQDTNYDDGRRVIFDSDQAGAFPWFTRSTSFDNNGLLDVQDTRYDDNTRVVFDWDNGDVSSYWDTWENFYNAGGTLYLQRLTLDNGSVVIFNI